MRRRRKHEEEKEKRRRIKITTKTDKERKTSLLQLLLQLRNVVFRIQHGAAKVQFARSVSTFAKIWQVQEHVAAFRSRGLNRHMSKAMTCQYFVVARVNHTADKRECTDKRYRKPEQRRWMGPPVEMVKNNGTSGTWNGRGSQSQAALWRACRGAPGKSHGYRFVVPRFYLYLL